MISSSHLILNNKCISNAAATAFVAFSVSFILVGLDRFCEFGRPFGSVIAIVIGIIMFSSLFAMIGATWVIARCKARPEDWKRFLFVIWGAPYLGIALLLGLPRLVKLLSCRTGGQHEG